MSTANNSNPRSLRNHSEAQACSDSSAAKLNDCAPAVRAAYEAAMGNWQQQVVHARKFGLPRPPEPQLADFIAVNGDEASNVDVARANGSNAGQGTQITNGGA